MAYLLVGVLTFIIQQIKVINMRVAFFILILLLVGCSTSPAIVTMVPATLKPATKTPATPSIGRTPPTPSPIPPTLTATLAPKVPDFVHIVMIIFENKEFGSVVGNSQMPYFNALANQYTLLTQHYAIMHPSLPNYIALMGGDTFGFTTNSENQSVNATSLPDLIEQSGRTWRAYQEDMPKPCFEGSTLSYVKKHNPFVYFDPIRLDEERCNRSVVPLNELYSDLSAGTLPNFVYITPNMCNSTHDCTLDVSDQWLYDLMVKLEDYLKASGEPYLILITFEEGQGYHSCCGLPEEAGGRVPTILVSPQAKKGFQDDTPYTHYSILKTIAEAWGLPFLGKAADENNVLIEKPFNP
jgi:phospholipase C